MNPRVAGFPGAVTAILRTLHPARWTVPRPAATGRENSADHAFRKRLIQLQPTGDLLLRHTLHQMQVADLDPLGHPDHLRVLLARSTRRPCLATSIIARRSLFPSAQGVPFQVATGSLHLAATSHAGNGRRVAGDIAPTGVAAVTGKAVVIAGIDTAVEDVRSRLAVRVGSRTVSSTGGPRPQRLAGHVLEHRSGLVVPTSASCIRQSMIPAG